MIVHTRLAKMFIRTIFSLFLIGYVHCASISQINKSPAFRTDYEFSELADGWLKAHPVPAVWSDAKLRCHAEGGVLASPLTYELKKAMAEYVWQDPVHLPPMIFTGVHATFSQGDYVSVEGVLLSEQSIVWAAGEPDNVHNSERCLAMLPASNGTMADVSCGAVLPYICYKKRTSAPLQISECGTSDKDYKLEPRTGSCYKFHWQVEVPWTRGYMTCAAEGAQLAVVNSEMEEQVLTKLYAENIPERIRFIAIGIRDNNDGGSWMTVNGESLPEAGYNKWMKGEPNNVTQPMGEFCGAFHRNGGYLDIPCESYNYSFVCEKNPRTLVNNEEQ